MVWSFDSKEGSRSEEFSAGVGEGKKIPVIFDTDICDDIDDTWALAFVLNCPELEVKLITTEFGNTRAKARMVAKFLEAVGRSEIPIGIGVQHHEGSHRYDCWAEGYELSSYPGGVYEDGVGAIVDTIMGSEEQVTVIAVGPVPNMAAALRREGRIAERAEFVGMHGSIRRGYGGRDEPDAEWNVKNFTNELREVFAAPWEVTITPLDTCGIVQLGGEKYQRVLKKDSPMTRALMENYRIWVRGGIAEEGGGLSEAEVEEKVQERVNSGSSTLFDTVAVYLAFSKELVEMERLGIRITDEGYTVIDEGAKEINCATEWMDLGAFEDFLVNRLTGR